MSTRQRLNLLVFRPGRRQVRGPDLKAGLLKSIRAVDNGPSPDALLSALLRSGELECSAADSGDVAVLPFAEMTDCLAEGLLRRALPENFPKCREAVVSAAAPGQASVSTPEGFAYYALHPLAYADALERLPGLPQNMLAVGIRSIGSTLSAVVAAAARQRGLNAQRLTVRPGGHPYDRHTEFPPPQQAAVRKAAAEGAVFLVVDEGPGLSGSSFLSVAEALERAGASPQKIILLCGHEPDPRALCSVHAAERWQRFRHIAAPGARRPAEAEEFIGAGEWRRLLFRDESGWPESWTSMERLKYLSAREERRLFKFAGLGHYGEQVLEREQAVAAAGFGPVPRRENGGFVSYTWLDGRAMSASDLFSPVPASGVLARLAEYCAFRARAFPANEADARPGPLQEMAEHNLREFQIDLPVALKWEKPVLADGRMQPHEWLLTATGEMLKTDSGSHGEDHFFPGFTDIAWDLAGAIVEWRMETEQASEFLELYRRASGDDAAARVADFIHAYAVFRGAYCKMAANAMAGTLEQARLERASTHYIARLKTSPDRRADRALPEFSLAAKPEL
jgi:hypothetical protein